MVRTLSRTLQMDMVWPYDTARSRVQIWPEVMSQIILPGWADSCWGLLYDQVWLPIK